MTELESGQGKKLEIGDRVRAFREREGMSQESLALLLGVSGNYIYMIEKGTKVPGESLLKLFETIERSHVSLKDMGASENPNNVYSHLETATLMNSLADLSCKLPGLTEHERKYVIGNLRSILDVLEERVLMGEKKDNPPPSPQSPEKFYEEPSHDPDKIADKAGRKAVEDLKNPGVIYPKRKK